MEELSTSSIRMMAACSHRALHCLLLSMQRRRRPELSDTWRVTAKRKLFFIPAAAAAAAKELRCRNALVHYVRDTI
jgi:hypothetical protein